MQPATSVARGLRFCAALRRRRRLFDLVDLVAEAPPNRRSGGLAGFLDRLAGALAASAASTRRETVLGQRRERGRRGNGDQLRYQRALQKLDEHLASVRPCFSAARALAPNHRLRLGGTLALALRLRARTLACRLLGHRHCSCWFSFERLTHARAGVSSRSAVLTL